MEKFDVKSLKQIYIPAPGSHKGQNGKVLIIGGSVLFHAGAIWPLEVASKMVDMVYFSSVDENNELVKGKFKNGIVVPRKRLPIYIEEADSILIGPGLPREEGIEEGDEDTKTFSEDLFKRYPNKKWVVDGGSLQTIEAKNLPKDSIITPHQREFEKLFGLSANVENAIEMAKQYHITILLKGHVDYVTNGDITVEVEGGNAGMTKGGTGDVLAGLVASFFSKNDAFLSACVASYINKKAGESLARRVGIYFNATDLVGEIPQVLKSTLQTSR